MRLLLGDCREVLKTLSDASVDSVVTDPPYELGFMGKAWDGTGVAYDVALWREVLRVLKPGGHLLAFGGARTYHRLACAVEDAGFEIRDQIMWVYGSGFPKSHDVSKRIDKEAGAERESGIPSPFAARRPRGASFGALWLDGFATLEELQEAAESGGKCPGGRDAAAMLACVYRIQHTPYEITAPATDDARQWQGWGTALKPSHEDLVLAQKPYGLSDLCHVIGQQIVEGLCQFLSNANAAGETSTSSRAAFCAVACDSAQWNAAAACNTPSDLFALMDTWRSESAMPSSLSIVWSWLNTLDAILSRGSTFTTETATSLTTDLKTLSCLFAQSTLDCITEAVIHRSGTPPDASLAERIFNALSARLEIIHELSAREIATSKDGGSGLRPDHSPIVVARKPLIGTVAENVLAFGTGAINVDGCRVDGVGLSGLKPYTRSATPDVFVQGRFTAGSKVTYADHPAGRWPANLIHDGSAEVVERFPDAGGGTQRNTMTATTNDGAVMFNANTERHQFSFGDTGSAARFFYTAKADATDRDQGLEAWPLVMPDTAIDRASQRNGEEGAPGRGSRSGPRGNHHPTVKPTDLMRYLCRLVTPPGGIVLDPFLGSGSTGKAAGLERFDFIGIELDPEYLEIARARIAWLGVAPAVEGMTPREVTPRAGAQMALSFG